jgi:hypothetical protein
VDFSYQLYCQATKKRFKRAAFFICQASPEFFGKNGEKAEIKINRADH